ncbi:hypothetical protein MMC13_002573 [Lambiella insularis]|nr:hypothetical protein [Lambiella insularis]
MAVEGEKKVALESLELLGSRLRKINFYTTGTDETRDSTELPSNRGRQDNIQARLQQLDDGLKRLASRSTAIEQFLNLYNRKNERIIQQISQVDDQPAFSISERLAIINSCATLYPTSVSRLTSIQDLPVPSAESSASLIALHPRLAKVELLQKSQSLQLAELRVRTASVLQRWYEIGVLGRGECWTEWEGRMMEVEKVLRREEGSRARELTAI